MKGRWVAQSPFRAMIDAGTWQHGPTTRSPCLGGLTSTGGGGWLGDHDRSRSPTGACRLPQTGSMDTGTHVEVIENIQLQWTGIGEPFKACKHIMWDYPGFRVNSRESGTTRAADVTGRGLRWDHQLRLRRLGVGDVELRWTHHPARRVGHGREVPVTHVRCSGPGHHKPAFRCQLVKTGVTDGEWLWRPGLGTDASSQHIGSRRRFSSTTAELGPSGRSRRPELDLTEGVPATSSEVKVVTMSPSPPLGRQVRPLARGRRTEGVKRAAGTSHRDTSVGTDTAGWRLAGGWRPVAVDQHGDHRGGDRHKSGNEDSGPVRCAR